MDAWATTPNDRPNFHSIVESIEKGELLFPETSAIEFQQFCTSTRTDHNTAIQGILTLSLNDIAEISKKPHLSDYDIEVLTNIACNSKDIEMISAAKDHLIKEIVNLKNSKIKYSRITLTTLAHFAAKYPIVSKEVIALGQKLGSKEKSELFELLLERLLPSEAINYIIAVKFESEVDCKSLLNFGIGRGDSLAQKIAEEVTKHFPKSKVLYDSALRHPSYFKEVINEKIK